MYVLKKDLDCTYPKMLLTVVLLLVPCLDTVLRSLTLLPTANLAASHFFPLTQCCNQSCLLRCVL